MTGNEQLCFERATCKALAFVPDPNCPEAFDRNLCDKHIEMFRAELEPSASFFDVIRLPDAVLNFSHSYCDWGRRGGKL